MPVVLICGALLLLCMLAVTAYGIRRRTEQRELQGPAAFTVSGPWRLAARRGRGSAETSIQGEGR